jgi:hypothetical protein
MIHEIWAPHIMRCEDIIFHQGNTIAGKAVLGRPTASCKAGRNNARCGRKRRAVIGENR